MKIKEQADLTQPGGGEDSGGAEGVAAQRVERSHLTHLFFLSLPLSPFLITEKAG